MNKQHVSKEQKRFYGSSAPALEQIGAIGCDQCLLGFTVVPQSNGLSVTSTGDMPSRNRCRLGIARGRT